MKRLGIVLAVCLVLTMLPVSARAVELDIPGKSAILMDMATGTVLYKK